MIRLWNSRKELGRHPNISGYIFLTGRNYCLDLLRIKKTMQAPGIKQEMVPDIPA